MLSEDVHLSSDVWPFVEKQLTGVGFDKELIHGLRHMRHVQEECGNVCRLCSLDPAVAKCLRVAVDVHDLGRIQKGDHAAISAEMFAGMDIVDLNLEEREIVCYAVLNHSRGLWGMGIQRAESWEEKVLGLLCLCDHADAASPDGAGRSALALKNKPVLSDSFSAGELRKLMSDGCMPDMMNVYKNDSLVAHWAFNYFATENITEPVRHILSNRYMEECAGPRLAMYRAIIEPLIRLQEEKDNLK